MGAEIIEAASVELELSADRTLLGVTNPEQGLAATERFAQALKAKIAAGGLSHRIGNQDYLGIEALQMASTALGVVGVVVGTRQLEKGWEATAEARTLDGRVVGRGVSVCSRDEPRWARKADFELLGMAQTRSLSRALRGPVGSVVSLASYAVTPAEEAPTEPPPLPEWAQPISSSQLRQMAEALKAILLAAGVPEQEAGGSMTLVGRSTRERCDGQIPVCLVYALELLAQAIAGPRAPRRRDGRDSGS